MPKPKDPLAEIRKEEQALQASVSTLKRECMKLEAQKQQLTDATETLEATQKALTVAKAAVIEAEQSQTALDATITRLDDRKKLLEEQITEVAGTIQTKKDGIDAELAAYELAKKQEIKVSVLDAAQELTDLQVSQEQVKQDISTAMSQLDSVNQSVITESEAYTTLKNSHQAELVGLEARLGGMRQEVKEVEAKLQAVLFKYDQAKALYEQSETDHKQFIEYERKAKMLLENKDRELQEKETRLATQSQFIQNRRSYLSEM